MGVRSHPAAPPPAYPAVRARPRRDDSGRARRVRPAGRQRPAGRHPGRVRRRRLASPRRARPRGPRVPARPGGEALVGKALAALFAALAAGALFAAVVRRHGLADARWTGWLLALGTTLAAAAQAWSGEARRRRARWRWRSSCWFGRRPRRNPDRPHARVCRSVSRWRSSPRPWPSPSSWSAPSSCAGEAAGWLALAWAAPGALLALFGLAGLCVRAPAGHGASGRARARRLAGEGGPGVRAGRAGRDVGVLRALRSPVRRLWDQLQPGRFLPVACGLAVVAHFAWVAAVGGWAAGDFWGPRLVAPAWPLLLLFLPEGFAVLGIGASLLALLSVAVQALGAVTYDGRWDRLHPGPAGGTATWDVQRSPIVFQARERVARVARPGLEGRRLVVRERVVAPSGASGSFLVVRESAARTDGRRGDDVRRPVRGRSARVAGRLELKAPGDGLGFRVPEGARARRLEIRIAGRGTGILGLGEGDFGTETRWRERAISGAFRFKLPYYHPESGGPDLRVTLRSGGPIAIESVALVPPTEPEDVLRLP